MSVRVALIKDNVLLEEGDAVPELGHIDWIYECTSENKDKAGTMVVVKAYDRPGNVGEKTVEVE
jgi:sorbitol-specific phosphotransferase system component IIA